MLIDTHAHLYLSAFDADRRDALDRAAQLGIGMVLMPAVDVATTQEALDQADGDSRLRAMAGIHPSYVHEMSSGDLETIEALARDPRIVAVGETGLDYYWTRDHVDAQHDSLREHARIAMHCGKPIVLHNRDRQGSDDCSRDLLRLLREARDTHLGTLRGVFHCFSGPTWLAHEVIDMGFYVGLGGTLTFKNSGVPEAIAEIPINRVLLETDSPYLAPVPNRGKRNEPAYTRWVAEKLADLRGVPLSEIESITTQNAIDLFGLTNVPGESEAAQSKSEQLMK